MTTRKTQNRHSPRAIFFFIATESFIREVSRSVHGLKKRGNALYTTIGKDIQRTKRADLFLIAPSYWLFFFLPVSGETFHPSYRLKTICTRDDFSISPRRCFFAAYRYIIIPSPSSPPIQQLPTLYASHQFSALTVLRFSTPSSLPPCLAYRCIPSFSRTILPSSLPPRQGILANVLCSSRQAQRGFTYPTIELSYLYIQHHMEPYVAERQTKIEERTEGTCLTLWRYKPQTRQTNSLPKVRGARDLWTPSTILPRPLLPFRGMTAV